MIALRLLGILTVFLILCAALVTAGIEIFYAIVMAAFVAPPLSSVVILQLFGRK